MRETKSTSTPAAECSETLLQVDENGEMEVREEYRGKIRYLDGTEPEERIGSGWPIGFVAEV